MRPALLNLLGAAARLGPESALSALVRTVLSGSNLALCLHRVPEKRRRGEWIPRLSIEAAELDRLLTFLLTVRRGVGRWLTVTFDDGYEDSARYILTRAARFPNVEFLFFVCPEKCERRIGFRWDLVEQRLRRGERVDEDQLMDGDIDPARENERQDLREMGRIAEYRLADVELCRRLQQHPNVALGNHTNVHLPLCKLTAAQADDEFRRSKMDFERLFGPQQHFAFPFGNPAMSFRPEHVAMLRSLGSFAIWSTEGRPHSTSERIAGEVLPRMTIDGELDWRASVLRIAVWARRHQLRRPQWEPVAHAGAHGPFAEPLAYSDARAVLGTSSSPSCSPSRAMPAPVAAAIKCDAIPSAQPDPGPGEEPALPVSTVR